jgi:hypothetical protein
MYPRSWVVDGEAGQGLRFLNLGSSRANMSVEEEEGRGGGGGGGGEEETSAAATLRCE